MRNRLADDKGSEKREAIMRFIIAYIERRGFPPTVREIKEGLGYRTTSAPYYHLLRLHDENRIEYTPGTARGIRVIK